MQILARTKRQEFIRDFFQDARKFRYAFLKYFYPTQYHIPDHSDLDIIIDKPEADAWKELIQSSKLVQKSSFREKSHALYVELFFEDGSFLEMDLIYRCKWKFHIFLQADKILDEAKLNLEGIKLASLPHSFSYLCLFYTLNSSKIPTKYKEFYHDLDPEKQEEILDFFRKNYLPTVENLDLFNLIPHRSKIIQSIKKIPENRGIKSLFLKYKSAIDRFTDPGITITFSGVDGAGKSTVLENTRTLLTEKYRKEVVLLRQRPSILPILSALKYGKAAAEAKAANTLPRKGSNTSRLSSLLRFAYYYLDYVLGQFYVYVKYNLRGHILLYDRYYFDYIVDPKRANLVLSPKLTRFLYRFVFKPELNFLLYADPDIILARKKELSRSDIQSLTKNFKGLFSDLERKNTNPQYISIHNLKLEETMKTIESAYLSCVGEE